MTTLQLPQSRVRLPAAFRDRLGGIPAAVTPRESRTPWRSAAANRLEGLPEHVQLELPTGEVAGPVAAAGVADERQATFGGGRGRPPTG